LQEPWIIALLIVQAALFVSVVLTRKRSTYQTCVFFSASQFQLAYNITVILKIIAASQT